MKQKTAPGWRLIAIIGVGLLAVGIYFAARGLWQYYHAHSAPVLTERRAVPLVADSPEVIQPIAAAVPEHLDIPVIDLSVDVAEQPAAVDGVYTPPSADHAYWLSDHGLAGNDADDTLFLLGHATLTGRAAFTDLVDPSIGGSRLQAGDEIVVTTKNGKVTYSVISSAVYERADLKNVEKLWKPNPGQLVLVTCLFDTEKRSIAKNVVVYARVLDPL